MARLFKQIRTDPHFSPKEVNYHEVSFSAYLPSLAEFSFFQVSVWVLETNPVSAFTSGA